MKFSHFVLTCKFMRKWERAQYIERVRLNTIIIQDE